MPNVLNLNALQHVPSIIASIVNWNAARYPQEYVHKLQSDLLTEELEETQKAFAENDLVEVCDGFGDIFYVAIGALWKQGLTVEQIQEGLDSVEEAMPELPPLPVAKLWWDMEPNLNTLILIALCAQRDLARVLHSDQASLDVIRAICTSNDTKAVKKTDAAVKANINKGEGFVPPTEAILTIIENVENYNDYKN